MVAANSLAFLSWFRDPIFVPVSEAAIAERFPLRKGERISLFSSITAVGRAIAPFLGGYILFLANYGYSSLYLSVGVAGVTAFIIALFFFIEEKNPRKENASSDPSTGRIYHGWLEVARNRNVQIVSFVQASQYYVFGAVEFFLVGYLTEIARLDAFSIGALMGSQIVASIVARPVMGRISDRIGRRLPIIAGSIPSALVLVAFPFTTQFPVLLLLSISYGLGFAAVISSTSPLISEIAPPMLLGTSLGFLSMLMDVGQTLGPIISGVILATSLRYIGLFASLSILLILSIVALIVSKTGKAKWNKHILV